MTDPLSDAKIIDSWRKNAVPWTDAVRGGQIESRRIVTNQAIIDAVLTRSPRTALDIGCGEGWLVRALADRGVQMMGVDVVPELIERATRAGGGDFRVLSYESIAAGELDMAVDVAIANFFLIGKERPSCRSPRRPLADSGLPIASESDHRQYCDSPSELHVARRAVVSPHRRSRVARLQPQTKTPPRNSVHLNGSPQQRRYNRVRMVR